MHFRLPQKMLESPGIRDGEINFKKSITLTQTAQIVLLGAAHNVHLHPLFEVRGFFGTGVFRGFVRNVFALSRLVGTEAVRSGEEAAPEEAAAPEVGLAGADASSSSSSDEVGRPVPEFCRAGAFRGGGVPRAASSLGSLVS